MSSFIDDRFLHWGGNLPHYDPGSAYQSITYRLADSLPQTVLQYVRAEYEKALLLAKNDWSALCFKKCLSEYYLDQGMGSCILRQQACAKIVIDGWKYFDGERYDLLSWVVMPNHVHLLIRTYEHWSLEGLLHSWKSYTANELSPYTQNYHFSQGEVWFDGYWDRAIRNGRHYHNVENYIRNNPVKAHLVGAAENWAWSSFAQQM